MAQVVTFYEGAPDKPRRQQWVSALARAIDQGVAGAYVNFVGRGGDQDAHAAYPDATYSRLAEIKRRYDPANLFKRNQNIAPAG